MSTNTGRHDYRVHAHDTVDNPLNGDPRPTADHPLEPHAPETELGHEGGFDPGQVNAPPEPTNLHLNSTVDSDHPSLTIAPETRLGQEHVNDDDGS